MPRQPRENLKEVKFYHIIVQGINREYIFKDQKLMNKYLELILENKEKYEVEIIAYCIMNNHVHLLMYGEEIRNISKMMQKVNSVYAQYYNFKNSRVGYVFRDRYLSQPIRADRQFINCVRYIHNNPVKAKIVNKPSEYEFSNYIEFYNKENLNKVKQLTGIDFMQIDKNKTYIESEFIDVDIDIKEKILNCIEYFCERKQLEIIKIFEDRKILRDLIMELKNKRKVKYVDIMETLDISRGAMERIKRMKD